MCCASYSRGRDECHPADREPIGGGTRQRFLALLRTVRLSRPLARPIKRLAGPCKIAPMEEIKDTTEVKVKMLHHIHMAEHLSVFINNT